LPQNLIHDAGKYPIQLYWAYVNEFSKEMGYDLTYYLGEKVWIEIYSLIEPPPAYLKPRRKVYGIIVKYQDNIIGAYIHAILHFSQGCSLARGGWRIRSIGTGP
jgi:hypothetical protein